MFHESFEVDNFYSYHLEIFYHECCLCIPVVKIVGRSCLLFMNAVWGESVVGRMFGEFTLFKRLVEKSLANE